MLTPHRCASVLLTPVLAACPGVRLQPVARGGGDAGGPGHDQPERDQPQVAGARDPGRQAQQHGQRRVLLRHHPVGAAHLAAALAGLRPLAGAPPRAMQSDCAHCSVPGRSTLDCRPAVQQPGTPCSRRLLQRRCACSSVHMSRARWPPKLWPCVGCAARPVWASTEPVQLRWACGCRLWPW